MTDVEERVTRALAEEAARAPDGGGLASGARQRARVRRRRAMAGGVVAAVVAIVVPVAVVASPGDPGRQDGPADERALDGPRVGCGGDDLSWPVSVMDDGVPGLLDETAAREAFAALAADMGIDAPEAIRRDGADRVPWVSLAREGSTYAVGVGPWSSAEGPARGAGIVRLERGEDGTLEASSWGDCRLQVALPAGRSTVGLTAPEGGVDPTTSEPVVMAVERGCTGGRDPSEFLGEPIVREEADRVVVSLTSEAITAPATCQGNPSVEVSLDLAEPLGDRELVDGGVWPPKPLRVEAGWQTVRVDDIVVDVPVEWARLDTESCEFEVSAFGPPGTDECGPPYPLAVYGSATFDPADAPGLGGSEGSWAGYVLTGDAAVTVASDDRETARRVLASARPGSEPAPDVESWWTKSLPGGVTAEVPADPRVQIRLSGAIPSCAAEPSFAQRRPDGSWVAARCRDRIVSVVAPTQALADLVASTLRGY